MTFLPGRDFFLEVAKGNVPKHTLIRRAGINLDVDNATDEDVWAFGGDANWYTSAQSLAAVSSSVNDTNTAGTGARTLTINGLDSSYDAQTESVSLNGTTEVNLSNTYIFIDEIILLTTGSIETNDGDVDILIQSAGAELHRMAAGYGQQQGALYQIPNAKTGYLVDWSVSLTNGTAAEVEFQLMTHADGIGWRIRDAVQIDQGSPHHVNQLSYLSLPAKTRVRVRANTDTDNLGVAATFTLVLVDD